ncbi:HlyD family efflux transporter periplasmic adaptor subunit [Cognatiyoonia sp. IB215182]|uniref:HlyD family efflux transporter periplasmic adaptor subunit n=1 Tax=Cognatiyoonia sp. IB215182 TaxID=3097353 RepID=UPI002A15EDC8|nr:HlyD family efflux transporter periplasmic adaptor subunit [Cognatiyoonia sp. IB215182]MDX8355017.1 HlyD family efflux transporter periplasmic adaptor subunit [Cognatiyoonia sp. IB215182]
MKDTLFREEAVRTRSKRLEGDVRLDAALGSWAITALLTVIAGAALTLLVMGEYPRRETVAGQLMPEGGLAEIRTDRAGRLLEIHAQEGDMVAKGAPLITIVRDAGLASGADANHQLLAQLTDERMQTERRLALLRDEMAERRALLEARHAGLLSEQSALEAQMRVTTERAVLAAHQRDTAQDLLARGTVTQTELSQREDLYLSLQERIAELRAAIARIDRARDETEAEVAALTVEAAMRQTEINAHLATLGQRRTEAEIAGKTVISAPFDGEVGALLAHLGDDLQAGMPVISLMPAGAALQAELLVPSRAAGFLSPGQPVRLRYDAFPHQTFGIATGQVVTISKTVVMPDQQTVAEPVFRVAAKIDAQTVQAYGTDMSLQPGMTLTADLVLETRTLWSLLTDPVRAAANR